MKTHGSLRLGVAILALAAGACDCGEDGLSSVAPVIKASPSPLDFGRPFVGIGATRALEITNVGSAPLKVSGLRLAEGTHPGVGLTTEAFELGQGELHTVMVRFVPQSEGPAYGAVLIDSDDPATPVLEVPLAGEGVARTGPVISVCVAGPQAGIPEGCEDPLRIDFGVVPFGQTRVATITIGSAGTAPLGVTSAAAEAGAHPSVSFEPATYAGSLAVGESQLIQVRFTPSVPETVTAVFQISSDDSERPLVPVVVTGGGVAPGVCPSEPLVDFGQVEVGMHADRSVTIESCGDVGLDLRSLAIESNPEFSVLAPPALPQRLEPGQSVQVDLRYAPTNPGRDQDRLVVGSSLPDSFVTLVGESRACDITVLPTALTFNPVGAGGSTTKSLLIENSGAVACQVTALRMAAGTSPEFSLVNPPGLPFSVNPGQSVTLQLGYAPTDGGSDTGTFEVASSDAGEPVIPVTLNGRRLNPGECGLAVIPDPIAFGAVPVGTSQTIQVQVQNTGTNSCTVSQVAFAASTSRDFRLASLTVPMLVRAGSSRTFDVVFTPRTAQPHTGELQIYTGLIPLTPDFFIPITGQGAGPMLCPMPSPLVFGTHTPGLPVPRQLQMVSCGTQDVIVSSLSLPAPTSSEFALSNPPATPTTIPPGSQVGLTVTYTGANDGRDDGVLRIQSNDAASATHDVPLIAHASSIPCGDIQGNLCDLSGNGPVAGATVYVDTASGRVQTTTDANGDWVLTCVPPGAYMVHAEYGSWSTTLQATVSSGQVTVFPGRQCLDPGSAEVAVVWGEWDQMQSILDRLNVPYTYYDQGQASRLVNDASELAQYDMVFFNCGWEEGLGLTNPGRTNIANFVMNGGSVYASDWAYDLIEVGWPAFVDFHGDDTVRDAAQNAGPFNGPVQVVEPTLQAALQGRTTVTIDSCCTAVDAADAATTVYLQGDRLNDGGTHPFMVSFQPHVNSGRVWYTDFHNNGQADIEDIFSWLILQL
ncbi:MAG: choice-of-anchor D domain-containing protein [Deltaproteobacteria bacterium]|nr:choice-of-anchor D domain-containing protein [Deltaproteobacteria bacterium]